jgi:hypothetical protein
MHKIEKIIVTPEEDALLKQKEAELLVKQQGTPQDEGQEQAPVQSAQESQEKGFLESKFDSIRNLPDKFMNENAVDFDKETRDFEREQKETKERIDKLLGE